MADEPNNNVQLGCGTLIVIAIIEMIFSGRDETADVRRELDEVYAGINIMARAAQKILTGMTTPVRSDAAAAGRRRRHRRRARPN